MPQPNHTTKKHYLLIFLIILMPFLLGITFLTGFNNKVLANVTLDNQTSANGANSWKHNVGDNPNRILIVGTSGASTAVTYDDTNLTLLRSFTSASGVQVTLWYLLNPSDGNRDIVITGGIGGGAASYYNVDQAAPFGTSNTVDGTNTFAGAPEFTISQSVNTVPGQVVFDYITVVTQLGENPGAIAPAAGQSQVWSTSGSTFSGASTIPASAASTTTMGWNMTTLNGTYAWAGLLVGINPAAVPTPTITPTPTPVVFNVTGNVFTDTNRNGVKDSGETNYGGASVSFSTGVTTTTNGSGNASFTNLDAGTYTVTLTTPANHRNTNPTTATVTVGPSQTVFFGIAPIYTLSGSVFIDENTNGSQNGSEAGFGNATVVLSGAASATITVDASGNYSFPDIYGGDYTVALRMPDGYRSTTANSLNFTLNATRAINFGIVQSSILPVGGVCTGGSIDIVVIFDRSNSMSGTDANGNQKFGQAKIAAHTFIDTVLEQLPSARIAIVQMAGAFNYPNPSGTSLVTSLTSNSTQLHDSIDSISMTPDASPYDKTCFECSVHAANAHLRNFNDKDRQKMVIFMTDGIANNMISSGASDAPASQAENAAMNETIDGVNRQNILYNTVGVGSGGGTSGINVPFLGQLANTNNGVSFINPTHGDLVGIYRRILDTTVGSGQVSGIVFNDANNNTVRDSGEIGIPNWTLQLAGGDLLSAKKTTTDSSGNYAFKGLCTNSYTVTQVVQAGWQSTTASSYTVDVVTGTTINNVDFGNRNLYRVNGSVFIDINKNRVQDAGDLPYTGGISITASSGTTTVNADGTYTVEGLEPGSYIISYTSPLPDGFILIYPLNGPPPSFFVTVGVPCSVDVTSGARCVSGDITNLDFAISNSIPWYQTYNGNVRLDNGLTNIIPLAPLSPRYMAITDAQAQNPGTIFIGNGTADFGNGRPSSSETLVGGTLYPEVYPGIPGTMLPTAYQPLLNKAQRTGTAVIDISTMNGCANLLSCTLPSNLPEGVYHASGSLSLSNTVLPSTSKYVFLVNGTLTLQGTVTVASGSAALFSAAQDIVVANNVAAAANTYPVPEAQIQGMYVAGRNFVIEGNNDCLVGRDYMLNIAGSIVVNALRNGGNFVNNRDLCGDNPSYPSFTIKPRLDFLLNAPGLLVQQQMISREVAP